MKILPLGETVLIKLIEQEAKTDSGIIITGTGVADDLLPLAEVLAIGPDVQSALEVGNTVLVSKYAGSPAPGGGRIIPNDQVLAICHEN